MASPHYHLYRGLRWFATAIWTCSKRFPLLHLLLFAIAMTAGALIAWLVPGEAPEHATAARIGGLLLGVACLAMLVRAGVALVRGHWADYCDRETQRARDFYDPERFR